MGSSQTQTYLVQTVYETVDRSSSRVNEISKSMEQASRNAHSLQSTLASIGGVLAGGMIFGQAKKHLIDYNSEIEKQKVVMAGMLSMYTGAAIEKSWDRAGVSVERFQEMAKKSSLTTKDLVETATGLTRPLLQAGVKMTDIEKLSFGAANAAKAFGIAGQVAAMDIEQALTTQVSARDRFAKNILAQKEVGLNADQFNALSIEKRVAAMSKGLTSKAVTDMARKQGEDTFEGAMSTLEDNFQIMASKAGGSLFKSLTEEVKGWNAWIDKNSSKLASMVDSLSSGLMRAFSITKEIATGLVPVFKEMLGVIGGVMNFAAEHKDTLIALAKGLLIYKGASMVGGMAMGALQGGAGLFGGVGGSLGQMRSGFTELNSQTATLKSAFGGLTTLLSGAGGLIGGVAKLSMALYAGASFLFGKTSSEKAAETRARAEILSSQAYRSSLGEVQKLLGEFNRYNIDPRGDRSLWGPMLKGMGEELDKHVANLDKTQQDLLTKGLASGFVKEEVTGQGERKLSLSSYGNTSTVAGSTELLQSLQILFKAKIEDAVKNSSLAGGSFDYDVGRWFGRRAGGVWGYYIDRFAEKQSKNKDPDADFVTQKIQQTVNVTIQRLMAKDPNRWLTELEDEAAKRTRNPTRAKNAWKNSGS